MHGEWTNEIKGSFWILLMQKSKVKSLTVKSWERRFSRGVSMNCPVSEPPCIPLFPTPQPSRAVGCFGTPGLGWHWLSPLFTQCLQASILPDYELQTHQQCCPGLTSAAGYQVPGLEEQYCGGQESRNCSQRLQSPPGCWPCWRGSRDQES